DRHSMTLISEYIGDVLREDNTATKQTIFDLSDEEPWTTLSRHLFGTGTYQEEWDDPAANIAQAVEAYVWMGGELEPGEEPEDRYCFSTTELIIRHLSNPELDPVPL